MTITAEGFWTMQPLDSIKLGDNLFFMVQRSWPQQPGAIDRAEFATDGVRTWLEFSPAAGVLNENGAPLTVLTTMGVIEKVF